MAGNRRLDRGPGAAERHAREVELEGKLEQFAGEMRRRADAGLGIVVFAGIGLLIRSTSSFTVLAGKSECTTRIFGEAAASVTGAKSLKGS